MKVLCNNFNCKTNTINPSFKHKIFLDIDSTDPRCSLKISAKTDDGKDIFTKSGVFVNDTPLGFDSSEDFVNKVGNIIADTYNKAREICKTKYLGPEEEKLSGIGIFVPGTVVGDEIAFIPNIKDKQGNSLKNIDFAPYKRFLTDKFSFETGMDVNSNNFKFIVTEDIDAAGLGIAKILARRDELNEDDYIMGVGGGFGSVDIKVKHGKVEIETSGSSSYLTHDFNNNETEELSRIGVCEKSHIGKYMDSIGMPEMTPVVIKTDDARIVTDNEISINNSHKELIDEILADYRFRVKTKDSKNTVIELDESNPRFANKMKDSRIGAVNNYADSISLIGINKINDGLNKIILVGPFAHDINSHIQENQEDYGARDLPALINQKIQKRIQTDGIKDLYNFEVICDDSINFPNNTYAGDALLNENLTFVDNRGSWMDIPVKTLKLLSA